MGSATCHKCNNAPAALETENHLWQYCLHCTIGCYFSQKWIIFNHKVLCLQIDDEITFLKAIKKYAKQVISDKKTVPLRCLDELATCDANVPIPAIVREYVAGLDVCYQSEVDCIAALLSSLLHTYKRDYKVFQGCDKEKLTNENLNDCLLKNLKWYNLFHINPNDPLKPVMEQSIFRQPINKCKQCQEVTLESVMKQYKNSESQTPTFCFVRTDKLAIFRSSQENDIKLYPVHFPFTEGGVHRMDKAVLCKDKLLVANGFANYITYIHIKPIVMIRKAARKTNIYGCLLVALNENVVYSLAQPPSQIRSEKYIMSKDKWLNVPKPVTPIAPAFACSFMGRFIYAFMEKDIIERLDSYDEEEGWQSVRIRQPLHLPFTAFQCSDGEILILNRRHGIVYEPATGKADKIYLINSGAHSQIEIAKGTLVLDYVIDARTYSLVSHITKYIRWPDGFNYY